MCNDALLVLFPAGLFFAATLGAAIGRSFK